MAIQGPVCAGSKFFLAAVALVAAACSTDESVNKAGGAVSPDGGEGGTTLPQGCNAAIAPSNDDVTKFQGALINAKTNDTICLQPGTYRFDKTLTLTGTAGITVKGLGADNSGVVLDFIGQSAGHDAFTIQADRFTIENLSVKDPPGDGVKVSQSDRPTFRNVHAYYTTPFLVPSPEGGLGPEGGMVSGHGDYSLYPSECTNVLIEYCEVEGSADASIYLGQSTTGIVHDNKAHECVIGVEAENSEDVEIYNNEAYGNTTGFLIVNLPDLPHAGIHRINAHDNYSHQNDHDNFGSGFATGAPPGIGVIVMAADNVELSHNNIENNSGTGILVASWPVFSFVGNLSTTDPNYDQYADTIYIHDNTFTGNGANPHGGLELIRGAGQPLEDMLWDGALDPSVNTATSGSLCIQNNGAATFRNFNFPAGISDTTQQFTDLTPHNCSFPPLVRVTLPDQ